MQKAISFSFSFSCIHTKPELGSGTPPGSTGKHVQSFVKNCIYRTQVVLEITSKGHQSVTTF